MRERAQGPRLVISGYYGFGNAGDEALLAGMLTGIRAVAPGVTPVVLSVDPDATSALHGVRAVDRSDPRQIWRVLKDAAALVSGGGSLLQDVTSRRSIYYYLFIMALARVLRRPYCLYGQGIGPVQSAAARRATQWIIQGSQGVWVRDAASADLVKELGARPKILSVVGDPAFLLPPSEPIAAGGPPLWVIAIRPWGDEALWLPQFVSSVGGAAQEVGASLLFLAMHKGTDTPVALSAADGIRNCYDVCVDVVETESFVQARQNLAGADMVLGMRLHALILAAGSWVPSVAISYDPKVEAFAQAADLPYISLDDLGGSPGARRLRQIMLTAWHARSESAAGLRCHARMQHGAAMAGLAEALAALGLTVERLQAKVGRHGNGYDQA